MFYPVCTIIDCMQDALLNCPNYSDQQIIKIKVEKITIPVFKILV